MPTYSWTPLQPSGTPEEYLKRLNATFTDRPTQSSAPMMAPVMVLTEDINNFDLMGFWNQRGTQSVCPATGKLMSPVEIPYLSFIGRLCKANLSANAHPAGGLCYNMLASNVEHMMFLRMDMNKVDEILDMAPLSSRHEPG